MPRRTGKAHVFRTGTVRPFVVRTDSPDNDVDGDLFWVWVDADRASARLSYETHEGQAREAVGRLIARRPALADVRIDEDSPYLSEFGTLGELASSPGPTFAPVADHPSWWHGTSSARLDAILKEGIRGDLEGDDRSWDFPDVPRGVTYLAADVSHAREYAVRAARLFGGDPVLVEVDGASLDHGALCEDHDFGRCHEAGIVRAGGYGGASLASASLTLSRKVGHRGIVPVHALVAVHGVTRSGDLDDALWRGPSAPHPRDGSTSGEWRAPQTPGSRSEPPLVIADGAVAPGAGPLA